MIRLHDTATIQFVGLSNTKKVMLWVDAWSTLHELLHRSGCTYIVDANWHQLTLDECEGLIQDNAYECRRANFQDTHCKGRPAVQVRFVSVTY